MTTGSAAVAVPADVWYRRPGHPHEAVVWAAANAPQSGIDLRDSMTKCDVSLGNKSMQQVHPKHAVHEAAMLLERVYTDLIGPLTPVAKRGFRNINKFTDELTRYETFCLIRAKDEALDTLVKFMQDFAIPRGLRLKCLRSDGGGQCRTGYFRDYCKQTGIVQEFTATNTPQQNGISEEDDRAIESITRCLLRGEGLPSWLWGEVCCTAVYLANRLSHSSLDFVSPFFELFGVQPVVLSHLHVVGSRAFVQYGQHRRKLQEKAWEGRLVGYTQDSEAYRIYNSRTRVVVKSRNVTFIETLDNIRKKMEQPPSCSGEII